MTILDINNISKSFGATSILSHLSFKLNSGERIGLIGENGSGKSTLLKMIVGIESPTEGVISKPGGTKVGYLAQHLEYGHEHTVYEEIEDVFRSLKDVESKLKKTEVELEKAEEKRLQPLMESYSRLLAEFEGQDGYTYESRINAVINGLGISELKARRVGDLSGGEKNIVALAKVLLEAPDVLLLDEPGNHLDFEGLSWLEKSLKNYGKSVILVSHDRYLLDRAVNRIVEIEDQKVKSFPGNYSAYRAEKLRQLIQQKAAFADQQKEIRRLEEMVRRFEHWAHITDNSKHARRARNKQKVLNRMDRIDRPNMDRRKIDPHFSSGERTGRIALELNGYSKAYGDHILFEKVDLLLSYGNRVGLLGERSVQGSGFYDSVKIPIQMGRYGQEDRLSVGW